MSVDRVTERLRCSGLMIVLGSLLASPVYVHAQLISNEFKVNSLVFDETRGVLYGSVPGSVPKIGNRIFEINPLTLEVGVSLQVGSNPAHMVLSDSDETLYVALAGAARIAEIDLPSWSITRTFPLGTHPQYGPLFPGDMEVQPGTESVIVVARLRANVSPSHGGLAVYEQGVMRPNVTPDHTGPVALTFSANPTRLYGFNNASTSFGFYKMDIDASGVQIVSETEELITGFGHDIEYADGRVFATSGRVVDPELLTLLGTYSATGFMHPDPSANKVSFFKTTSGVTSLSIFDLTTFTLLDSLTIPGLQGEAQSYLRWGDSGIAFRTNADRIYSMRTSLVWDELQVPPSQMTMVRGVVQSGGLPQLAFADNQRVLLRPGPTFSTAVAPISVDFSGTAPSTQEQHMAFVLEAHGSSATIWQKLFLFDFASNQFEQVSHAPVKITDERLRFEVWDEAGRFINPVTREVRARIEYKANGPVIVYPWEARIDLVRWLFLE